MKGTVRTTKTEYHLLLLKLQDFDYSQNLYLSTPLER